MNSCVGSFLVNKLVVQTYMITENLQTIVLGLKLPSFFSNTFLIVCSQHPARLCDIGRNTADLECFTEHLPRNLKFHGNNVRTVT